MQWPFLSSDGFSIGWSASECVGTIQPPWLGGWAWVHPPSRVWRLRRWRWQRRRWRLIWCQQQQPTNAKCIFAGSQLPVWILWLCYNCKLNHYGKMPISSFFSFRKSVTFMSIRNAIFQKRASAAPRFLKPPNRRELQQPNSVSTCGTVGALQMVLSPMFAANVGRLWPIGVLNCTMRSAVWVTSSPDVIVAISLLQTNRS